MSDERNLLPTPTAPLTALLAYSRDACRGPPSPHPTPLPTPCDSSVAPSTSPPIGRRLRRRRAPAATAGGLGNGGCKRRAAGATVEIALSVHACGQSALGAQPRAATGASMEPVRCAAGPRRSAVRRRLPDRSGRLRTRSRRTRLEAGHWHPACPTVQPSISESAMSKRSRRRAGPRRSDRRNRAAGAASRRSAARLRLPDSSKRLRTRSRRARLGAGHWHPACLTV